MTEETDIQQLNLIEYEEFLQTEHSTNQNNPETSSLPNCYQSNYSQGSNNNFEDHNDLGTDINVDNNCSNDHKDLEGSSIKEQSEINNRNEDEEGNIRYQNNKGSDDLTTHILADNKMLSDQINGFEEEKPDSLHS